jgi:hypothetical protein
MINTIKKVYQACHTLAPDRRNGGHHLDELRGGIVAGIRSVQPIDVGQQKQIVGLYHG